MPSSRAGRCAGRRAAPRGGLLSLGLSTAYLTIIVLIPIAAVVAASLEGGLQAFWNEVTAPAAVAALKLTFVASLLVVIVNAIFGTLIAWVLVRDEFRGKNVVNAIIDLPFALPTIVAGLVLLAVYGPKSPINLNLAYTRAAVVLALLFVTLPFVVRAVQPVLLELDREMEEAAASLGVVAAHDLPADRPAEPDAGDPLGRGALVREGGRRVRLGRPHLGEHPVRHRGRLGQHLQGDRVRTTRRPRRPSRSCSSCSRSSSSSRADLLERRSRRHDAR